MTNFLSFLYSINFLNEYWAIATVASAIGEAENSPCQRMVGVLTINFLNVQRLDLIVRDADRNRLLLVLGC